MWADQGDVTSRVRPLLAVLVPGDGTALLVLEAENAEDVRRVGAGAELPFDRVVPAVTVLAYAPEPRRLTDTRPPAAQHGVTGPTKGER